MSIKALTYLLTYLLSAQYALVLLLHCVWKDRVQTVFVMSPTNPG